MKIAFVGKGGSGKSTVSGLFVRHLINTNQKVLAIDADINQHFASMIGAKFDASRALALDEHKLTIRKYLAGDNPRISSPNTMIKTTPPGSGSNIITISQDDEIVRRFGVEFAPESYFFHVGTYEDDGIGMSCYHSSLSIFENVLSHTFVNTKDEWVVVDMVAGTDAFSGPLHAMFDIIFIVVEPAMESVAVYKQFIQLAKSAGIESRVRVVANKIEDESDIAYIEQETGQKVTGYIEYDTSLRKLRRDGNVLNVLEGQREAMDHIASVSRQNVIDPDTHLSKLHELHDSFARQQFTIDKYGDTLPHIDPEFSFKTKG